MRAPRRIEIGQPGVRKLANVDGGLRMEQDVVVVPIVGELSARMRPADFDEARVTAACYHLRLALRLWPQLDDLVEWLMLEAVVVSEDGKEAV